jgi:hypothetical protein
MHFLVDKKLKIIFGWSAKCGCSHIKEIFYFLQNDNINNKIHTTSDVNPLPIDIENYTTIIISRNPYKRVVSGFLDKYSDNGQFRKMWNYSTISFSIFVDELIKQNWKMIDKHHFTPQTTERFHAKILNSKCIKCYDIENIDYKYIENLYNKKLPEILLNKRQGHERKQYSSNFNTPVYNLNINEYYTFNVEIFLQ